MDAGPRQALAAGMGAAFLVALLVGILGIDVRATPGGRAAVDEPQYLLTALSLAEDGNLDISDELAAQRWKAFHDTNLPVQTQVLPNGKQISPHDPLLPVLIAAPMGLWGFEGAKAAISVIAGLTAALTVWVAVRRFGVRTPLAAAVVMVAFASPPLGVYAQQVYPEMAAALAVLVAVAAMTGDWSRRHQVAFVLAVIALPWLSVKYAAIAASIALVGLLQLWRARRRTGVLVLSGAFAAMGLTYVVAHRVIWGGWTVYASGDYFQGPGEFSVVGTHPDFAQRTDRLWALLLDRNWGIAAWQPAWLLVVPALAALCAARPRGWTGVVLAATAGWAIATWIALTMAGFWFPGRQLVVILPLLVLVVAWWLSTSPPAVLVAGATLGFVGTVSMAALLSDGWDRRITWVFSFTDVNDPLRKGWEVLLPHNRLGGEVRPDSTGGGLEAWAVSGLWLLVLAAIAVVAYRAARPPVTTSSGSVTAPSSVEVGNRAR